MNHQCYLSAMHWTLENRQHSAVRDPKQVLLVAQDHVILNKWVYKNGLLLCNTILPYASSCLFKFVQHWLSKWSDFCPSLHGDCCQCLKAFFIFNFGKKLVICEWEKPQMAAEHAIVPRQGGHPHLGPVVPRLRSAALKNPLGLGSGNLLLPIAIWVYLLSFMGPIEVSASKLI